MSALTSDPLEHYVVFPGLRPEDHANTPTQAVRKYIGYTAQASIAHRVGVYKLVKVFELDTKVTFKEIKP